MTDRSKQILPHARRDGLVVETLTDEVLVYDTERHKAHCLNQTAAAVWRNCDGQTTVAEVAQGLTRELEAPVDDRVVWLAVEQLGKARLLVEAPQPPRGLSRREALKRLGVAAAVALPLVTTIRTPEASAIVSCFTQGQACTSSSQCCPGLSCDTGPPTCQPPI